MRGAGRVIGAVAITWLGCAEMAWTTVVSTVSATTTLQKQP